MVLSLPANAARQRAEARTAARDGLIRDGPLQPERIRILVVDDHTLFRRGLTALLQRDPQFEVVGDAADAGEAQRARRTANPI